MKMPQTRAILRLLAFMMFGHVESLGSSGLQSITLTKAEEAWWEDNV